MYDRRGKLTPALVVDEARDPSHPLHPRFEWDDSIAGEAYRRQQAQELIRSVRVQYKGTKGSDGETPTVRAFHAIRSETGYRYEPVERVTQDPFQAKLVLADMEREWRQLKRRYEQFEEFWNMVQNDLGQAA